MSFSTIKIKFTQELFIGNQVGFDVNTSPLNGVPTTSARIENFVTTRSGVGEVTTPITSTGIIGEKTAINYYDALYADLSSEGLINPYGYSLSRLGNEVTITVENIYGTIDFYVNGLFAIYTNPTSVQFTTNNQYDNTGGGETSNQPILLEWSGAFDLENNISGYELSYKTTGSWIALPFIVSSQTSGTYSFTPTQQVTHSFRIRIRDTFSAVSPYRYFNYTVSNPQYQISTSFDEQGPIESACQLTGATTYTPIFLSSTPPAVGVTVYTDSTMLYHFNGSDFYWIIKAPTGLEYSCQITSGGVIEYIYLCGANSASISVGRSTANATCALPFIGNVYWSSTDSFVVGTTLFTNPSGTITFLGNRQYFIVEYTDINGLTLTKVVKIGNLTDPSVIVSIENKSTVCSTIMMSYRTTNAMVGLDGTALCQTSPNTKCYIRLADPSIISTGDIVYTNSAGTTIFNGGYGYYNMYISIASFDQQNSNAICQVDTNGVITVQGFCSANAAGCCLLPGTSITLFNGSTINIEDIIGGESLLTYNTDKSTFEEGLVTNIFTPIHNDIIKLVIGNNTIDCTSTHPFWSVNKNEWVSLNPKETILNMGINIEQLEIGDILLNDKNEEVILDDIIEIDTEDIVTYDISVEPNHTYYANTILVHNKFDTLGNIITYNELNNTTNP